MATFKSTTALAALALAAMASTAHAGGLEANGYNWDLLFDPATYAAKATVTHVNIEHDIENPTGFPALGGAAIPGTVSSSADRVHYNLAVKADFNDQATCLMSAQNPFGNGVDRNLAYAALTGQAARERLTSFDAGLTCSYGFDVGPGTLSPILGISAQTLGYEADIPTGLTTTAPLSIAGSGTGWRVGAAYEIPEIALRVSAIYNAAVDYTLTGTAFGGPATADATTPQSFEVKGQTGIAPGWLVLGSVKWVDWSVLQSLSVATVGPVVGTDFSYRDGWTVTGGVGHAITPDLTLLGTITWDRGTSSVNDSGVLISGTQTDRWGATLGGAYNLAENLELSGGVSYSIIGSGENLRGETWDDGSVLGISASLKAHF
ncbi:OmpP1/FadL family transporter [Pelagibacterium luteolum]|uniref:Long-chain fatty acid transport protein n=1 Tax=Pelagibacterium luteolum TaxID=440168 RepID=A0A1G7YC38_9HYPH|nr:outer membrane protein transport protein [Pelagibacterium luteolum]SDG93866.1 long-chain fatty acid transport protein [Pelagibacterium luteolum]